MLIDYYVTFIQLLLQMFKRVFSYHVFDCRLCRNFVCMLTNMVICRRSSLELSGSCVTLIRFSPLLPSAVFLSCSMLWSSSLLHPAHLAVFSDRHRQLLIYIYTVVRSSSEWMTCWTSFSSFICCFTLPSLPYPLICYFPLPLPISVFPLLFRLFCFSFSLRICFPAFPPRR